MSVYAVVCLVVFIPFPLIESQPSENDSIERTTSRTKKEILRYKSPCSVTVLCTNKLANISHEISTIEHIFLCADANKTKPRELEICLLYLIRLERKKIRHFAGAAVVVAFFS